MPPNEKLGGGGAVCVLTPHFKVVGQLIFGTFLYYRCYGYCAHTNTDRLPPPPPPTEGSFLPYTDVNTQMYSSSCCPDTHRCGLPFRTLWG